MSRCFSQNGCDIDRRSKMRLLLKSAFPTAVYVRARGACVMRIFCTVFSPSNGRHGFLQRSLRNQHAFCIPFRENFALICNIDVAPTCDKAFLPRSALNISSTRAFEYRRRLFAYEMCTPCRCMCRAYSNTYLFGGRCQLLSA